MTDLERIGKFISLLAAFDAQANAIAEMADTADNCADIGERATNAIISGLKSQICSLLHEFHKDGVDELVGTTRD